VEEAANHTMSVSCAMPLSEDSTMRVQAEDALHNNEERIRLILDSATEAICGCDAEGTCLFSNLAAARILGYDDPAELLGKNMHALEHHTREDGTHIQLKNVPSILASKKTRTFTGTMRFIGERMARAFLWNFGPILSFAKVKPWAP